MNPDKIEAAIKSTEKLLKLEMDKIDMLQRMLRLFKLAKLEPRVMKGTSSIRVIEAGGTFLSLKQSQLVIKLEDGTESSFSLLDVPVELIPDERIRAAATLAWRRREKSRTIKRGDDK